MSQERKRKIVLPLSRQRREVCKAPEDRDSGSWLICWLKEEFSSNFVFSEIC